VVTLDNFIIDLTVSALKLSTPIIIAAIGETFAERSGVLNIGIEGGMLTSAFVAYLVSIATGNALLGIASGVLTGGIFGVVHAYLTVITGADQIVTGVGINLFSLGLSTFLYKHFLDLFGQVYSPGLPAVSIGLARQVPVLRILEQTPFVYISILLAITSWIVLFRSHFGLKVTASGEHPLAAETAGIDVHRIRCVCVIIGGLMAGLAGASLSLGLLNLFTENMVQGRGFVAVAIVILGNWTPINVFAGGLIFGAMDSLQMRLQAMGTTVPYPLLLMLPYLFVTVALAIGRVKMPQMLCVPYVKEKKRRRTLLWHVPSALTRSGRSPRTRDDAL